MDRMVKNSEIFVKINVFFCCMVSNLVEGVYVSK